jgi:hypothetical protein
MIDFISDKTYKGIDFTVKRLPRAEYEQCMSSVFLILVIFLMGI